MRLLATLAVLGLAIGSCSASYESNYWPEMQDTCSKCLNDGKGGFGRSSSPACAECWQDCSLFQNRPLDSNPDWFCAMCDCAGSTPSICAPHCPSRLGWQQPVGDGVSCGASLDHLDEADCGWEPSDTGCTCQGECSCNTRAKSIGLRDAQDYDLDSPQLDATPSQKQEDILEEDQEDDLEDGHEFNQEGGLEFDQSSYRVSVSAAWSTEFWISVTGEPQLATRDYNTASASVLQGRHPSLRRRQEEPTETTTTVMIVPETSETATPTSSSDNPHVTTTVDRTTTTTASSVTWDPTSVVDNAMSLLSAHATCKGKVPRTNIVGEDTKSLCVQDACLKNACLGTLASTWTSTTYTQRYPRDVKIATATVLVPQCSGYWRADQLQKALGTHHKALACNDTFSCLKRCRQFAVDDSIAARRKKQRVKAIMKTVAWAFAIVFVVLAIAALSGFCLYKIIRRILDRRHGETQQPTYFNEHNKISTGPNHSGVHQQMTEPEIRPADTRRTTAETTPAVVYPVQRTPGSSTIG